MVSSYRKKTRFQDQIVNDLQPIESEQLATSESQQDTTSQGMLKINPITFFPFL